MLKAFQKDAGYNDLDDWAFADMAEGLGGRGVRVTTRKQLASALAAALSDASQFQLIEIMIPRNALSRTLIRFTAALAEKTALSQT